MNPESFFGELKRRNVIRMVGLYLVGAWLVVQVAGTVLPMFGAPEWLPRTIVVLLAIGFVPAVIFSWVFELTPQGLKRDEEVAPEQSITPQTGRRMDRMIIVVLVLALGYFAFDKFVLAPRREGALVASAVPNESKSIVNAKSIAVLPFVNMSEDKANEYFSDGISEELLNLLSKIPQLQVTARTSSFSFKGKEIGIPEIARTLHVAHVLEGSVRKAGNSVRITAQLIKAGTDTHLWSQTYDRKLDDIFAIQDEIAADVVKQLKVTLLGTAPKARTTDPEAYALYLQAVQLGRQFTAETFQQSDALYRKVLAIDPRYAPAWYGLARNFGNETGQGLLPGKDGFAQAREAAMKALAIEPDYAPAHASLGYVAMYGDNDLAGAALHLERALALDPVDLSVLTTSATLLQSLGRLDEALALEEAARPPRSGERECALQPGLLPAHGRPARRGDRVVPHPAELEPEQWRRPLPARRGAAAEGRCEGRAGGDRAGDERDLQDDRPADGLPRARAQDRLRRGTRCADREVREGRALQHCLRLRLPRRS